MIRLAEVIGLAVLAIVFARGLVSHLTQQGTTDDASKAPSTKKGADKTK